MTPITPKPSPNGDLAAATEAFTKALDNVDDATGEAIANFMERLVKLYDAQKKRVTELEAALAKAEAVNANLHKVCQGYEATIRGLMDK